MNVQHYRANSIQEYCLNENVLHGDFHDELPNYDLVKVIVLNLGMKPTSHKLLNLLHLLFMDLKLAEEKEKILHDQYNITLTRDMQKELDKMGGLMEPLLKVAVAEATVETERKNLLNSIRNAMDSWGLSTQDAMTGLKISPERQKELLPLI